MQIKFIINIIIILFLTLFFLNIPLKSQTQFILDNEKSIIGIPIYIPNTDSIIVKKFDGKIDTISKSNIVFENEVKVSIITNKTNYVNVENLKIIDSTYHFTFRKKDIILHKDSIINIIENVGDYKNEDRTLYCVGLGFPYGLNITSDIALKNNNGYRVNFNLSNFPSLVLDYYFNQKLSENIEHNLSFSGGLYYSSGYDFAHGHGPKLGFTIGSTYDLKIHFLMIRAGGVLAPAMKNYILPNVSVGIVFEL